MQTCSAACGLCLHTNACIALAWLCGWDFISVWPFKRFLQGRGGGEDNGSRHYLLLSCWLNIRPHTLWPSPIRMPSAPAHMLRHDVRTSPDTYRHARETARGQNYVRAGPEEHRSHTYAVLCPDRCMLGIDISHHFRIIPKQPLQGFTQLDIISCTKCDLHAAQHTCARVGTTIQQWRNAFLYVHRHAPLSRGDCNVEVTGCAHASYCCTFAWVCEGERQCRSRFHSQSGSISSGRPQSRPPRGKLPTVCTSRDDCPCWGGGIAHALSYSSPHTAPHSFAYTHVHTCVCTRSLQLHTHTHTFAAILIAVLVLHVFAACTHFETYCTRTDAHI